MPTPEEYIRGVQKSEQRRKMQKSKKKLKRNRAPKSPRRRDWMEYADEDVGYAQPERVMPRDERERRHEVEQMATGSGDSDPVSATVEGPQATVVEVSTSKCRVALDGRTLLCDLRGSLTADDSGYTNVIAVGDQVIITESGDDQAIVERVLPRQSALVRPDVFYSHLQQVIAANVDQLLIVASWRDPHIWLELIDRYLITAARNNLDALIVVNKVDLAEDQTECEAQVRPYRDLGYPVCLTSTVSGQGLKDLAAALEDKATVLAGMSGVGKSSILTAIQPDLDLKTSQVSDATGEGRHTTTQARMWPLAMGGYVIDTPGIREFGLAGMAPKDLVAHYPDIEVFAAYCRFRDCSHRHEPGCAVREAVERSTLVDWRYENYVKLWESLSN